MFDYLSNIELNIFEYREINGIIQDEEIDEINIKENEDVDKFKNNS